MKKGDPGTGMTMRNHLKEEVYPRVILKRLSESVTHPFQCTRCQMRFHKVYEATEHYFNSHQIFCDSFGKPFIKDLHVKNSNENKANKNNHKNNSQNENENKEIIDGKIVFKTEYPVHEGVNHSNAPYAISYFQKRLT